jgi:hypothetical protein
LKELQKENARLRLILSRRQLLAYEFDPVAFIHDKIDWPEGQGLTGYQDEMLSAPFEFGRDATRGPRGLGKTCIQACRTIHYAITRDGDDWKNPTLASAWRHLSEYLWPEIHKWSRLIKWDALNCVPWVEGESLLDLAIRGQTGSAFALTSHRPELIEGAHATRLLQTIDESKNLPVAMWDASEGAFNGPDEVFVAACGTPGQASGRFFDLFTKRTKFAEWHVRHVTLAECIAAGRMTQQWADNRALQWGADSSLFANHVLGEFSTGADDLIPLAWVEAAQERWHELNRKGQLEENPLKAIGADIADSGVDRTALAYRHGNTISRIVYGAGKLTSVDGPQYGSELMAATGRIRRKMEVHKDASAVVDVGGGWGASVVGALKESFTQLRVVAFQGMVPTAWKDRTGEMKFLNLRAAAYWNLREMLDPKNHEDVALPPDNDLVEDLTIPKWLPEDSHGRTRLEPKDSVKDRLGRSPDAGDSVAMAFWLEQGQIKMHVAHIGTGRTF